MMDEIEPQPATKEAPDAFRLMACVRTGRPGRKPCVHSTHPLRCRMTPYCPEGQPELRYLPVGLAITTLDGNPYHLFGR